MDSLKSTSSQNKNKFLNLIKKLAGSIGHFLSLTKLEKIWSSRNFSWQKQQTYLDKKLVLSLAKSRIPTLKQLKYINKFLSPTEHWLIRASFIIIIISLIFTVTRFYLTHLQIMPKRGGVYSEGLIGAPKYINPLYASISDVDNDLSLLIYSSLFKRGKTGELVKDLVETYEISPDNKVYTFTIKPNAKWHNGDLLTVGDVIFTIDTIKDAQYKSPLRLSFTGVTAEKIDSQRFKLILDNPYAPFLDLLTFGIMPANLWSQIPPESIPLAELNIKPIESGPYGPTNLIKDKTGNIKEYDLSLNDNYYGNVPYLNLKFKFYPDFQSAIAALNNGEIDGLSYLPQEFKNNITMPNNFNYHKLYLPQLTALFINQSGNAILADKALRQALAYAIDRNAIINQVLDGDAYLVDSPILPNSFAYDQNIKKYDYNIDLANKLLDSLDYKWIEVKQADLDRAKQEVNSKDEKIKKQAEEIESVGIGSWRQKNNKLSIIKLTTVERNENRLIVEEIKKYWEKIGIRTELEIIPAAAIQIDVIKPRNFEILFYGQVVGADPDPYPFWHSSQAQENRFNIANFMNKEVDQLLEDARLTPDIKTRQEKYKRFQEILAEELPAIFMYSPTYTYVQSKNIKGFDVKNIYLPRDRFANINEWYIQTGRKIIW